MPNEAIKELCARLRANRKNSTFGDLRAALETGGFSMHPRNKGSHRAFTKPGCFQSPSIPEGRGPVKPAYVTATLRALEECSDE